MKFGKVLHRIGEELPDRQFLRYKELKKLLKHIKGAEGEAGGWELLWKVCAS